MGRKFTRFMIDVDLGSNAKVGRLSDAEFRCMVTGVWALAAKAPIRGALVVGDHNATPADIARQAHCSTAIAKRTLAKMRDLGMLDRDDELGCEVVHDWHHINPAPKVDRTAADRMRRYRERLKARNAQSVTPLVTPVTPVTVTPPVTPTEVEGEKTPLTPRGGNGESERGKVVTFNRRRVPNDTLTLAEAILEDFNAQAGTSYGAYTGRGKPSEDLKRILGAIHDADPPLDLDEARHITEVRLRSPFWQGRPHTGVVFGPGVFAGNRENAKAEREGRTAGGYLTTDTDGSRVTDVAAALKEAYGG